MGPLMATGGAMSGYKGCVATGGREAPTSPLTPHPAPQRILHARVGVCDLGPPQGGQADRDRPYTASGSHAATRTATNSPAICRFTGISVIGARGFEPLHRSAGFKLRAGFRSTMRPGESLGVRRRPYWPRATGPSPDHPSKLGERVLNPLLPRIGIRMSRNRYYGR